MSFKKINLIAIPTTVLLVVFRLVHLLNATDKTSGFSASLVYDVVLYSILGAIFLFFVFNFYYTRRTIPSTDRKNSKLISYTVIIFAVYCEFMSVLYLLETKNITITDNSNLQLIQTIKTICAVLGIIVGICLVFESVKSMSVSAYVPNLLICCVVVLYFVVMLFTFYVTHDTLVTVPQNLLSLFFWMSVTVFIYAYLRYLSGSKATESYKLALIFGYFSAVCGTVVTIPRMVASFFVNYTFTSFSSVEQIMILPTTLLSVVIVYNLTSSRTFNHVQETQKGEEI